MPRFTLYRSQVDSTADVAKEVRAAGGKIISARPNLALIEASEVAATELRHKLKDWKITREGHASIPSPRPAVI